MVISPGETVPLLSFSSWIAADTDLVDWGFCPYPFTLNAPGTADLTNSNPGCGVSFGGGASSD
jgi:hypothetical protein